MVMFSPKRNANAANAASLEIQFVFITLLKKKKKD